MNKRNLPVTFGNGGGRDIDAQARHYTVQCLQKIAQLLHAQKEKDGDDTRLQFAAAKFLLELGWGRTPLRRLEAATDDLMTPDEQQNLRRFIDEYARASKKHLTAPVIDGTVSGCAGDSQLEDECASGAADA